MTKGAKIGRHDAYANRDKLIAYMRTGGEYHTSTIVLAMGWAFTRTMTTLTNAEKAGLIKRRDQNYWSLTR